MSTATGRDEPATNDWVFIPPADAGFAQDPGEQIDQAVEAGELPNLHAVVVARRGRLVAERYYTGTDEASYRPVGLVRFDQNTLHDLRSIQEYCRLALRHRSGGWNCAATKRHPGRPVPSVSRPAR